MTRAKTRKRRPLLTLLLILALEEAAVLVEDIVPAVAGEAFKGGVDVDQDAVAAVLLGNDNAIVGVLDHQLQEFCVDHWGHP